MHSGERAPIRATTPDAAAYCESAPAWRRRCNNATALQLKILLGSLTTSPADTAALKLIQSPL